MEQQFWWVNKFWDSNFGGSTNVGTRIAGVINSFGTQILGGQQNVSDNSFGALQKFGETKLRLCTLGKRGPPLAYAIFEIKLFLHSGKKWEPNHYLLRVCLQDLQNFGPPKFCVPIFL